MKLYRADNKSASAIGRGMDDEEVDIEHELLKNFAGLSHQYRASQILSSKRSQSMNGGDTNCCTFVVLVLLFVSLNNFNLF